jgi:hypothetical protein
MFDEIQPYAEHNRDPFRFTTMDVGRAIGLGLSSEKAMSYIYNVAVEELLKTDQILLYLRLGRGSEALSEQEKWDGIMGSTRIREGLGFRPGLPGLRAAILQPAL